MNSSDDGDNLPAPITAALSGIPAAFVPASLKAIDRLIGAAVDIPVAWLAYQKAKIESKTDAFRTVDGAITKAAASKAELTPEFADRALEHLVRGSYRRLTNKESVSRAMLEELKDDPVLAEPSPAEEALPQPIIEDDWLNVFERYAEDASTERMQKLWGRVLAGEVRNPGKFGMRTLRFLSEFSQADALEFSSICQSSFGGIIPKSLVKSDSGDMTPLLNMEAAGLLQGASGMGLTLTLTHDNVGNCFLLERPLAVMFKGRPGDQLVLDVIGLTPLGQELITLLPGRVARDAARVVGLSFKKPEIKAAFIMSVVGENMANSMEVLWQEAGGIIGRSA